MTALILIGTLVLWAVRGLLWPQDSGVWLRIMGYGAIPVVLAWVGDHFAVEAIKAKGKRRMYRVFFFVCSVLAISLIAIVENKAAIEHRHEQERIGSLLSTISLNILHPPLNPEHQQLSQQLGAIGEKLKVPPVTKVVVEKPPIPSIPLTTEERFRQMTNSELREYTISWANKLRDFEKGYFVKEYSQLALPSRNAAPVDRNRIMDEQWARTLQLNIDHEDEYKKYYWGETRSLYAELINRLNSAGVKVPETYQVMLIPGNSTPPEVVADTINEGALKGWNPISTVASYLEVLARAVPVH